MIQPVDYLSLMLGISAILAITYLAVDLFGRHSEKTRFRRMTQDLRGAILNSTPEWSELKAMAATYGYRQVDAARAMEHLQREIMVGRDEEMKSKLGQIRDHIESYRGDKPFEEISQEIRIHLERLRGRYPKSLTYLEPLANQIKELLTLKSRQMRRQRLAMYASLILGLAGAILGAVTVFQPQSGQMPAVADLSHLPSEEAVESADVSAFAEENEAASKIAEESSVEDGTDGVLEARGQVTPVGEGLETITPGVP